MDKTANDIRNIIQSLLNDRGLSCDAAARKAGIHPTTLTRFINHQTDSVPSTRTLMKLEQALGQPIINQHVIEESRSNSIPIYESTALKSGTARNLWKMKGRLPVFEGIESADFAVTPDCNSMDLKGISLDDIVICSPLDTFENLAYGSKVCVQSDNTIMILEYHGQFLLPMSSTPHLYKAQYQSESFITAQTVYGLVIYVVKNMRL